MAALAPHRSGYRTARADQRATRDTEPLGQSPLRRERSGQAARVTLIAIVESPTTTR